ncbi:unnamed protein product [Phaedon cochleariae]|uniref:Uncharacterized protein n=1 Tax=Phaedon cochleariae TaxID=80249 RepID=A0A9N9SE99_PHACE|nr:unnamed protein product [Phaedon cochleariae]
MVFLIFLLVSLIVCSGQTISSTQKIQSNFRHEESCSEARGYCVLENECQHPVEGKYKSLCPMQQTDGAICCKDFPMEDANCHQLHNECKDSNCTINLGRRGCAANQLCCVLMF